ncbi:hypothetical protein HYX17_02385 [Candidatus Woesearchaeota archaeon]|nr:hypothetical protein [Candidatus Woesearchaeota archaeon]
MELGVFVEGYYGVRNRRQINLFDYVLGVDTLDGITSIIDKPSYYILSKLTEDFVRFLDIRLSPLDEKVIKLPFSLQLNMYPKFGRIRPRAIITKNGRIYVDPDVLNDAFDGTEWYLNLLLEELKNQKRNGKISIR